MYYVYLHTMNGQVPTVHFLYSERKYSIIIKWYCVLNGWTMTKSVQAIDEKQDISLLWDYLRIHMSGEPRSLWCRNSSAVLWCRKIHRAFDITHNIVWNSLNIRTLSTCTNSRYIGSFTSSQCPVQGYYWEIAVYIVWIKFSQCFCMHTKVAKGPRCHTILEVPIRLQNEPRGTQSIHVRLKHVG